MTHCLRTKRFGGGSNLSITDKHKFYFTNVSVNLSDVPALEMLSVELRFLPAAELNFYSDTMLYYASLTNIRQGVKQDTRVQLQVMNNLIKLKFI